MTASSFVEVQGVDNFRDIGGYNISSNHEQALRVRRGIVYRSSQVTRITPRGLVQLRDSLGIKRIYDLRSRPEWAEGEDETNYDAFTPGVTRISLPVFSEEGFGPADEGSGMIEEGAGKGFGPPEGEDEFEDGAGDGAEDG